MRTFKIEFKTESGSLAEGDGIEYENKLWLVYKWLEFPATQEKKPVRIIRFDSLPTQKLPEHMSYAYMVNVPIPNNVLDGSYQDKNNTPFEIVESPDISISLKVVH